MSELNVYPLKSAGGTALAEAELTPLGVRHDRTFMLIRPDGRHLSQRETARLALLRPTYDGTKLTVHSLEPVAPLVHDQLDGPRMNVTVHRQACQGVDQGDLAADWFSAFLGTQCRLVRFSGARPTKLGAGSFAYADQYPILVISQESLDDLNQRLAEPLPMNRFRPNVVLAGLGPYGEDHATTLHIGEVEIDMIAPCGRCVITTTDQRTGIRGREPLRTLATFRTQVFQGKREIVFGRLAIPRKPGTINVGDAVQVT